MIEIKVEVTKLPDKITDISTDKEEMVDLRNNRMTPGEVLEAGKDIGNVIIGYIDSLEKLSEEEKKREKKDEIKIPFEIAKNYLPRELKKIKQMLLKKEMTVPLKDTIIEYCIETIRVLETDEESLLSRCDGTYPVICEGMNIEEFCREFSIYLEVSFLTKELAILGGSEEAKAKLAMFYLNESNFSKIKEIVEALELEENKENIVSISFFS